MLKPSPRQILLVTAALFGWAAVYVFQEFDFTRFTFMPGQYERGIIPEGENWRFAINKSMRFLLNDLFSVVFIYGLFNKKNYLMVAVFVMLVGAALLLPAYLFMAINHGQEGSPLLVFLHRITMNPWLTLMLVPAFYYQNKLKQGLF